MDQMTDEPKTQAAGRAAFIAILGKIRAEIARGDYMVDVHARHRPALGIGYSAFRKLVQRYAEDAKPTACRPSRAARQAPAATAPPRPSIPSQIGNANVGRNADHPRTFHHDGRTKEGEAESLFGFDPRTRTGK